MNDQSTLVLGKQLVGIDQLTNILINSSVKRISAILRSYEEDPHAANAVGQDAADHLGSFAVTAAGNTYTAYPFEVDFEASPENLRTVLKGFIDSPYLFVLRAITIQSDHLGSPDSNTLDRMAGISAASLIGSSPGEVGAATSTRPPQYLFGNAILKVRARVDMIEWKAQP